MNWAIGKHVRLPLTDRLIPIIADEHPGGPEVRDRRGEGDAGS